MGILWIFLFLQLCFNVCLSMNSSSLLSTDAAFTVMPTNSINQNVTPSSEYSNMNSTSASPSSEYSNMNSTSASPSSKYSNLNSTSATTSSEYLNINSTSATFRSIQTSNLDYSVINTNILTQETISAFLSSEFPASSSFENSHLYSSVNTLTVLSMSGQSISQDISQSSSISFSQSPEQTSLVGTQTDFISQSSISGTTSSAEFMDSSKSSLFQTQTSLMSESHVSYLERSSLVMYSSNMVSPSQSIEPMSGSPLLTSSFGFSDLFSASYLDLNSSMISTTVTPNIESSYTFNISSSSSLHVTKIIPTSSYFLPLQTSALAQEMTSASIESSFMASEYDGSSLNSTDVLYSSLEPSITTSNITSLDGVSSFAVEITTFHSRTVSTPALESYIGQSSSQLPNITITAGPEISPSESLESVKDMASASVTPHSPNVTVSTIENITCEIQFEGDCELLTHNKVALGEFWEAFVVILSDILPVKHDKIKPKDIACKPIRLSFYILEVESPDLSKKLANYVNTGQLSVPVLLDSSLVLYTAIAVEFDPDYKAEDDSDIFAIGLRQVDIIVIISACLVSLVLICVGFFICAREYYYKKRTRSFDLSEVVHWNMNMEDYTLTKIPRPKTTYTDKGVKMNSFRKKNGSSSQELKAQVENIPISEVNNDKSLTDVQLRMDSNSNGLIVGVTGTSEPLLPANQQSPTYSNKSCDKNYDSEDNLYEEQNSPLHCADNPIYYADDDRFSSV